MERGFDDGGSREPRQGSEPSHGRRDRLRFFLSLWLSRRRGNVLKGRGGGEGWWSVQGGDGVGSPLSADMDGNRGEINRRMENITNINI